MNSFYVSSPAFPHLHLLSLRPSTALLSSLLLCMLPFRLSNDPIRVALRGSGAQGLRDQGNRGDDALRSAGELEPAVSASKSPRRNRRQIGCSVSSRISPRIRDGFIRSPILRSRSRNRVTTRRFFPADSSAISVPVKRFSEAFLLSRLSNESERDSARPRPFLATPREQGSAER